VSSSENSLKKEAEKKKKLLGKVLKAVGLAGLVSAGVGAASSASETARKKYAPPEVIPPGY
jgi:hypothetical protein